MYKRLELVIFGKVQGIFFRKFVKEKSEELKLDGFVENQADGTVKVIAEGEEKKLQKLIEICKTGSKLAQVKNIEINWLNPTQEYKDFIVKY